MMRRFPRDGDARRQVGRFEKKHSQTARATRLTGPVPRARQKASHVYSSSGPRADRSERHQIQPRPEILAGFSNPIRVQPSGRSTRAGQAVGERRRAGI
jgi:hypothetical protein